MLTKMKNWFKKKLKWLIFGILGIGVAFAAVITDTSLNSLSEIQQAQETYFAQTGEYLQIIQTNKLPSYKTGTVKEKLGKDVSSGFKVDIYETSKGEKGYQITEYDNWGHPKITAFGVEANSRNYTHPEFGIEPIKSSATSTP